MQDRTTVVDIWTYPRPDWSRIDLSKFHVMGTDGEVGTVDRVTQEAGAGYLMVETGPWIFGRTVMLPAGVISDVHLDEKKIFVELSKGQIERAPEWDEGRTNDAIFREELGSYYGANSPTAASYGASGTTT